MFCLQASPEWTAKAPVPAPLSSSSLIVGVPVDLDLLSSSSTARQNVAASASAMDHPKLSAIFSCSSMQRSVSQMQGFINSCAGLRNQDAMLHKPVLGSGSTHEVLPVKLLCEFDSTIHLRSCAGIADLLSRLSSISVAGIAAPAADRLVRPQLAGVCSNLAAGITRLSTGLQGPAAVTQASAGSGPKLSCTTHKWHLGVWMQPGSKQCNSSSRSRQKEQQMPQ